MLLIDSLLVLKAVESKIADNNECVRDVQDRVARIESVSTSS